MTTVNHTAGPGPVTLHIDTQAADVQVVTDPRASGTWIELSTPDESGPAVTAIRNARFRDDGGDVYLSLKEGNTRGNATGTVYGGVVYGNGMTMVNGVSYGGGASGGILVRAITEPGSTVEVKTMSGDVSTKDVRAVRAKTMSGDIRADGVSAASSLKTMSGDIRVTGPADTTDAAPGGPRVTAQTMSGDVTGTGVDLHAHSMSGRVNRRRAAAVDEW